MQSGEQRQKKGALRPEIRSSSTQLSSTPIGKTWQTKIESSVQAHALERFGRCFSEHQYPSDEEIL
jgi:hypothetical protein